MTYTIAARDAETDQVGICMIYLCAIANRCDVDQETEFRVKEEKNKGRTWR